MCSGFFNSYGGPVANQDVDYVLHLGDYVRTGSSRHTSSCGDGEQIYEKGDNRTGAGINRTVLPEKEIFTVQDYRQRYATYRTDPCVDLGPDNCWRRELAVQRSPRQSCSIPLDRHLGASASLSGIPV